MKERNQRGLAAGLALALGMGVVIGCSGGSSGGGGSSSTQSVSGSVVANTVNGAVVRVYQINADRSLTFLVEGTTEADGTYTIDAPGTGPFYVVAGGGTYQDEATGQSRSLGGLPDASSLTSLDQDLSGVLSAVVGEGEGSGSRTIGLNPLTTLAAQRTIAASQTDESALSEASVAATNQLLASEFGVSGDPRAIDPLDFTSAADASAIANGSSSPEAQLGAVLAALSQAAEDQGLAEPLALIDALAEDFSDGVLDGQAGGSAIQVNGGGTLSSTAGTSDLSSALTNFLDDTSVNASGTTTETFSDLVEAVDSQDVAPAGVNLRPNVDAIANQSVSVDAGEQTVAVTGIDAGSNEASQVVTVTLETTGAAVTGVTLTGQGATRAITYTPAAAGTSTLTLTVSDDGGTANGGVDTFSRSFTVTVTDPAPAPAPTPTVGEFTRTLASAGEEGLVGVAQATSGTVVVGYTRATPNTQSASGYDVYVAMYGNDGTLLFARQVADTGMDVVNDMAIDALGNVLVVGNSDGNLNTTDGLATNGLLLELSAVDGSVVSTKTLGGNTGTCVAVLGPASRTIVVGGEVNTDGSGLDGYVEIYDEGGDLVGSNAISATGDQRVTGVSIDAQNGIAVGITTFGDLDAAPAGNGDPAVRKLSYDGSTIWTRQIGSAQVETTSRVVIDGNGDVFLGGTTQGVLDGANAGGSDAFLWQVSSDGTSQTVLQFGTTGDEVVTGLASGVIGSVVIGGTTTGSLHATNLGGLDAWVRQVNGSNQTTGSAQLGGPGDDSLRGLSQSGSGAASAAGDSTGTFNGVANGGDLDGWLTRLGTLTN